MRTRVVARGIDVSRHQVGSSNIGCSHPLKFRRRVVRGFRSGTTTDYVCSSAVRLTIPNSGRTNPSGCAGVSRVCARATRDERCMGAHLCRLRERALPNPSAMALGHTYCWRMVCSGPHAGFDLRGRAGRRRVAAWPARAKAWSVHLTWLVDGKRVNDPQAYGDHDDRPQRVVGDV